MKNPALLWRLALAASLIAAGVGCAPKIEPEIASASTEATYASQYPAELQRTLEDLNAAETKTKELSGKFSAYPDELKSPPWAKVLDVVNLADAEGRAYEWVETKREVDGARAFFDAEKDEITRKVAGAANFAAKQKCGDVDVSGAVQHSLKEVVEKRLEKRLREHSEAHIYIDRNKEALGKDNVPKLEEQADDIAYASYLSHIVAVEHKVRLRRMVLEAENIKKTLDASIKAEEAYQAEPNRKPDEKKASEERVESMKKAQGSVDSAVKQAQAVSERADERVAAIQKTYDDAILKLRNDLKKRAGQ